MFAKARLISPCVIALALTIATAASGQEAVPDATRENPGDIVVEGSRHSPQEQARRLAVEVTKHAPMETPVARFQGAPCFGTVGLPAAMGQALVNRMMDNALAAGAPVAPDGCKPNVLVLFMNDATAELKKLRETQKELFSDIPPDEMRANVRSEGPVQVLNTVEVRGKDGDAINGQPGQLPEVKLRSPTRIMLPTRLDLIGSVVIIARSAVPGKSIDQLADYATMRSLARTRDSDPQSTGTILSLFTAATPPAAGMTQFDRAYLRALYLVPANGYAASVMTAVGKEFAAKCNGGPSAVGCE